MEKIKKVLLVIKKVLNITSFVYSILVQLFVFGVYIYDIVTNKDRFNYFVIYICLFAVSLIAFIFYLATYRHRKHGVVREVKRGIRISKYLLNIAMIVVTAVEIYYHGATFFRWATFIWSIIAISIQLFIEACKIGIRLLIIAYQRKKKMKLTQAEEEILLDEE